MFKPALHEQQQQYTVGDNELLVQRIYATVSNQIIRKRWEFQYTDMNPDRLWNIANDVEALNWISRKLRGILRHNKPVPDSSIKSLIASLIRVLADIDQCLSKSTTNKQKPDKLDRLKSRANIIEWSLFQIHFVAADISESLTGPRIIGIQNE
jgi:hypothetical protein